MLWLLFDGWYRFVAEKSFAFSFEENSEEIAFFIPKSEIGLVTRKVGGDCAARLVPRGTRIEAVQMSAWLAKQLAEEHGLEYEK